MSDAHFKQISLPQFTSSESVIRVTESRRLTVNLGEGGIPIFVRRPNQLDPRAVAVIIPPSLDICPKRVFFQRLGNIGFVLHVPW